MKYLGKIPSGGWKVYVDDSARVKDPNAKVKVYLVPTLWNCFRNHPLQTLADHQKTIWWWLIFLGCLTRFFTIR